MRILVFGASGFIGASLISSMSSYGHEVTALCRSNSIPGFNGPCLYWKLGDSLPSGLGEIDCAIHLAHDFGGEEGAELTIFGTSLAVNECAKMGITRQIFFSSYSSGEHAISLYGKTKYQLEKILSTTEGIMVVRPGLVLGNGGIYGRIKKFAQSWPVIPFPCGDGRVPIIEIDRLCIETNLIATGKYGKGPFNLFEEKLFNLRDLISHATAENSSKPFLLPIPIVLVKLCLYIGSILNITLPINKDNLAGFMANQVAGHTSTLDRDFK